ncbi:hypothetical protein D3C81_703060 [compost metagenome]
MAVEAAAAQLGGGGGDRLGDGGVEHAATQVGPRRRHLVHAEGVEQAVGKALFADLEDRQRPLRLGAPVAVGGDVDRPEGVVFYAICRHGAQSGAQSSEMLALAATAFQRVISAWVCLPNALAVYCSGGSSWIACAVILPVKALSAMTFR